MSLPTPEEQLRMNMGFNAMIDWQMEYRKGIQELKNAELWLVVETKILHPTQIENALNGYIEANNFDGTEAYLGFVYESVFVPPVTDWIPDAKYTTSQVLTQLSNEVKFCMNRLLEFAQLYGQHGKEKIKL